MPGCIRELPLKRIAAFHLLNHNTGASYNKMPFRDPGESIQKRKNTNVCRIKPSSEKAE
jgi:hypothetical protein